MKLTLATRTHSYQLYTTNYGIKSQDVHHYK